MKLKKLTVLLRDGLANRMRVIASIVNLARQGVKVNVLWLKNWALNCDFEQLFEKIDCIDIINIIKEPVYYDTIQSSFPKTLYSKLHGLIHGYDFIIYTSGLKFQSELCDKNYINNIFNKYKNVFLTTCFNVTDIQDYSVFKFNSQIEDTIIQFKLPEIYYGVHIRRGDNVASMETSRIEGFIDKLNNEISLNPDAKFYLATDSYDVKSILRILFGDDRIIMRDNSMSRDSSEGIQEALVDMIVLAKAKKIIGTAHSSFDEVASMLYKSPLEKVITSHR